MTDIFQRRRGWIELSVLILTIPIVILLFRTIEERRIAAVIAGALFVGVGLLIVFLEGRYGRAWSSTLFWNAWVFLLGSALPIMGLRLSNWNSPFEQTSLLGIPGPAFHQVSNAIYTALIVTTLIEMFKDRTRF